MTTRDQSGQEPQKVNTTGDDPRLSSAVASARQAIRLRTPRRPRR
ncbi:MAG TPA: hypothetical protein VF062_28915 [Candidatus Limnocylindrales bacterium]